jgi:hypothetical protein
LDYLEDAIHIAYLAKPSKTPGSVRVFVGWSISKLKFLASAVGMAGLAAAILLLGRLQIDHFIAYICAWRADNIEQYVTQTHSASSFTVPWLLAVALALAALYLAFSTIVAFLKPEPKVRCL